MPVTSTRWGLREFSVIMLGDRNEDRLVYNEHLTNKEYLQDGKGENCDARCIYPPPSRLYKLRRYVQEIHFLGRKSIQIPRNRIT